MNILLTNEVRIKKLKNFFLANNYCLEVHQEGFYVVNPKYKELTTLFEQNNHYLLYMADETKLNTFMLKTFKKNIKEIIEKKLTKNK